VSEFPYGRKILRSTEADRTWKKSAILNLRLRNIETPTWLADRRMPTGTFTNFYGWTARSKSVIWGDMPKLPETWFVSP